MKNSEHQVKPRRAKSRQVSARFLSPTSSSSPNRRHSTKPNPSTTREYCLLNNWDNNDSQKDLPDLKRHDQNGQPKQRTSSELSRFEANLENTKENRRPSPLMDDDDSVILPGRFSVDECALCRTSSRRISYSLPYEYDSYNRESDSELSDVSCASNLSASHSVRTRKPGILVPSKYLHDSETRPRKRASDCSNNINNRSPAETSQMVNNLRSIKNLTKRTDSLTRYGRSKSQWALSPGRSGSPPLSLETKVRPFSFSRLKPPLVGSPPRAKGVSKLLNLGLDFFKSKKSSSPLKLKPCDAEAVHRLKLLHSRLVQWRFVNARADAADKDVVAQGMNQLLCAWDALTKLEHSVVQERIGLQKRKWQMKLDHVLLHQIKHLETWESIERQHHSALSMTKQSLDSVVSRLPLIEGAEADIESVCLIFRQALAITDSIRSTLPSFASWMEDFVPIISELAEVAAQEKLMLEECHDLLRTISELEIQERSLRCCHFIQHKQTNKNFSDSLM